MWKAKRMIGDLGTRDGQVHAKAREVLDFWLRVVPPEKRFARNDGLDAECARRFGSLRDELAATGAAGWWDAPEEALAAVIVLDQFSRNIHRGSAEAFAADPIARAVADKAIASGWDAGMDATQRQFLYMPFMHSEALPDQDRSVALFEALGEKGSFDFAQKHRDVIARFGRFPGRNAALGRETSAEEEAFLASNPGF